MRIVRARANSADDGPFDFEAVLWHDTLETANGRPIGCEETKDAGVLTSRVEYDSDGIEITNVDNPPPGSEVEKRRRKRKQKQPFASPNSGLVMNNFSLPAAKDDEPSDSGSDDNIGVASASTLPTKPEFTKKPATQLTEASTTAQKRPRRGKVIRWYPDEDEWTKTLIVNNLDKGWAWYAEQNRLQFEGTQYTDPTTGEVKDGVRGTRSNAAVRERFVAYKNRRMEEQGVA